METNQSSLITTTNTNNFILKIRGERACPADVTICHLQTNHNPSFPGVNQSHLLETAGAASESSLSWSTPCYKIGGGNVIKLARGGGHVTTTVRLYMWPLVSNEAHTGLRALSPALVSYRVTVWGGGRAESIARLGTDL